MAGVTNNKSTTVRKRTPARAAYKRRPTTARRESGSKRKSGSKADRILLVSLVLIFASALLLLGWSYSRFHMGASNEKNLTRINLKEEARTTPKDSETSSEEETNQNVVLAEEMKLVDFPLGGMSLDEAATEIKDQEEKILSKLNLVKFTGGPEKIAKTPYQLGLRLDIDAIMKKAEEENGKGAGRNPVLNPVYKVDENVLAEAVEAIREEIDRPGMDAQATGFDPNTMQFTYSPEQEGMILDVEDTLSQLRKILEEEKFDRQISLKIERTPAGKSAQELSAAMGLVASATTPIMYYSEGRNHNVQLAADRISGTILQPGESFSYNNTIGPMTEMNGFALAGIQDEFGNDTLGVGGGLCQPSTTIYQAAVRAGMRIDVHHFHSTPVTYCPIGQDAMVTIGADLVFTNTTPYPYTIMAYFDGASLTFNFYGPARTDGIEYDLFVEELESEPLEGEPRFIKDETLAPGETEVRIAPRPVEHVKVYRKTYQNGVEIASELMYDHKYPGGTGVIAGNMESLPPQKTDETATASAGAETTDPLAYPSDSVPETEESVVLYYAYDEYGNLVPVYAAPTAPSYAQPTQPEVSYYYYP